MDERHQTLGPGPGLPVNQLNPRGPKLGQGRIYVFNFQADVVEPLTPPLEKSGHRAVPIQRLQELNVGPANRQEGHPHPVSFNGGDVFHVEAEPIPEKGQRRLQAPDRDRDVVNPLRFHG